MDSQKWHEARIVGLATSPDRTRFAFASADEILSVWDLYDAPGGTRSAFSAVQRRGDVRRWDGVLGKSSARFLCVERASANTRQQREAAAWRRRDADRPSPLRAMPA